MVAACVQIAVDAFAHELVEQGVPADAASAAAEAEYLRVPEAFSPIKPSALAAVAAGAGASGDAEGGDTSDKLKALLEITRQRESLLLSAEKGGEAAAAADADAVAATVDLIGALTDRDMAMVDDCARRLEEIATSHADGSEGADDGQLAAMSYGLAMNAFLCGLERCHVVVDVQAAPEAPAPEAAAAASADVKEEAEEDDEDEEEDGDMFVGASLRALFDLPGDAPAGDAWARDEELVSLYAEVRPSRPPSLSHCHVDCVVAPTDA